MKQTTVKWFDNAKSYGFLFSDGGDVMVHYTAIRMQREGAFRTLKKNQAVEYQAEVGDDGRLRATEVVPL